MLRFALPMFVMCGLLLGAPSPLAAQDMPGQSKAEKQNPADTDSKAPPMLLLRQLTQTHPERILMLFDRLAGRTPDFQALAAKSPFLNDKNALDRDSIINREDNRLRRAWAELDTEEPIVVHTTINLANYSTMQEQLFVNEFNGKTFFNFKIYDENIAIVPKGIAAFGKIAMPKAQMDDILSKTISTGVRAELLLKPVMADGREPFVQNNINHWLILAEIGEIRFWNMDETPKLLWMHRADWYRPKENTTLMDLKGGILE